MKNGLWILNFELDPNI